MLRELGKPLEIREVEIEAPRAGEVRLRVAASGVCRSDLSVAKGTLRSSLPVVLGHEAAGGVEELGARRGPAPLPHVAQTLRPETTSPSVGVDRDPAYAARLRDDRLGRTVRAAPVDATSRHVAQVQIALPTAENARRDHLECAGQTFWTRRPPSTTTTAPLV